MIQYMVDTVSVIISKYQINSVFKKNANTSYLALSLSRSTEYGLQHNGKNVKIEIKTSFYLDYISKITINDRCYDSK